jgi:hypothetical protein
MIFMTRQPSALVPEFIERRILIIRGQKVLLSMDLAKLYAVQHKVLMQAVRRNIERFPRDFMFQLTRDELGNLKSQFVTSSGAGRHGAKGSQWGGIRKLPYAFTEQGVAMLSGVLNSKRAVAVNIEIMRAFVHLREILSTHKDLARKLEELEQKYDKQFRVVFEAIRQLMAPPEPIPKRRIGFGVEEPKVAYRIARRR